MRIISLLLVKFALLQGKQLQLTTSLISCSPFANEVQEARIPCPSWGTEQLPSLRQDEK